MNTRSNVEVEKYREGKKIIHTAAAVAHMLVTETTGSRAIIHQPVRSPKGGNPSFRYD